jgi:hypothetical protein
VNASPDGAPSLVRIQKRHHRRPGILAGTWIPRIEILKRTMESGPLWLAQRPGRGVRPDVVRERNETLLPRSLLHVKLTGNALQVQVNPRGLEVALGEACHERRGHAGTVPRTPFRDTQASCWWVGLFSPAIAPGHIGTCPKRGRSYLDSSKCHRARPRLSTAAHFSATRSQLWYERYVRHFCNRVW